MSRHLDVDAFATLAQEFAAASATHRPSWAWLEAEAPSGAFAGCPGCGYLRASPLLLPSGATAAGDTVSSICDDDEAVPPSPPSRLELHVVHSATYGVPVLLLQGQHGDGSLWSPDELRAHLAALAEARGAGASTLAPLTQVSQMEHPVLRVPCCCIDPCETGTLMGCLLEDAEPGAYLRAWWSMVAPLVGAESHAVWFRSAPSKCAPTKSSHETT